MRIPIFKYWLTLFFILILSATTLFAQSKDSVEGDFEALMALYASTGGENWNNSWDLNSASPETMGSLYGITVYPVGHEFEGRVRTIKMNGNETLSGWGGDEPRPENVGVDGGNNLTGELPPEIGNLQKLKYINVKQNFLTGEIPAGFWTLQSLEWAALAGQYGEISFRTSDWNSHNHSGAGSSAGKGWYQTNSFTGDIPEDIDLPELVMLEIRKQFLTGVIPMAINGAPKLKAIFLNDQRGGLDRLGGNLPKEIGDLTELNHFHIGTDGQGNFDGELPSEFLKLENLKHIRLANNNFSGSIPVFATTDMRVFDLANNNFTGGFPISLFQGDNPFMSKFDISDNNLSGEITEDIIQPDERNYAPGFFDVMGNNFEGPIPFWIRSMLHKQMKLGLNNFTGGFPVEAAEAGRVRLFWIYGNNLSGNLPDIDWNSYELSSLIMSGNNFEGPIPESWETIITNHLDEQGNFEGRLGRFEVIGNELSGVIPSWIAEVPTLYRIKFHNNRFTFKDILPNYQAINNNVDEYVIAPQKPFGSSIVRTMPVGEKLILDLREFDYEGNQYQWVKDGIPVEGATESVLTIGSVTEDSEGEYVLQVTNPALPELGIHSSEPITFQIGENDEGNSGGNDDTIDNETNDNESRQKIFPEAPVHIGPDSSSINVSLQPTIAWSSVEGADYYILHMSRSNPDGMVLDITVDDTTYTPSEILGGNTLHQWRVRAVKNGEPGKWSGVWKFSTSDAEAQQGEEPLSTELKQNYPNPFNPSTQIEYVLTELEHVKITVYNIAGQHVATLVDDVVQPGRHRAIFDAAGSLASGVYLYRFVSDSHRFTKKMTLLK